MTGQRKMVCVEILPGHSAWLPAPTLNEDRAASGLTAMEAASVDDPGTQSGLVDLLANLMHTAKAESLDFEDAVRVAAMHFDAEEGGNE